MCSGEHILMKGKSEKRAICTASAVLPHPTGPTNNINTVNLDNVHTTPQKLILKTLLISTVGPTIHTYPSRRRSLSKTLFRPEEFENTALFLRFSPRKRSYSKTLSQQKEFENASFKVGTH